jgi:hypothetical protein
MPKPLPNELPRSRYSYEAVTLEIERILSSRKRGAKAVAARACNLRPQAFSQRLRGLESKFKVEHFGAIADSLNAPPGWPFVSWELAEEREDALRKKTRK